MGAEQSSWIARELTEALDVYEQELRGKGLRRNTISTYVQHPERFIRWLQGSYSPEGPRSTLHDPHARPRSKYDPLSDYLVDSSSRSIQMTFVQIERILGFDLPASARQYSAWWANESGGTHSHARSWLDASYETRGVDLGAQAINFVRRASR